MGMRSGGGPDVCSRSCCRQQQHFAVMWSHTDGRQALWVLIREPSIGVQAAVCQKTRSMEAGGSESLSVTPTTRMALEKASDCPVALPFHLSMSRGLAAPLASQYSWRESVQAHCGQRKGTNTKHRGVFVVVVFLQVETYIHVHQCNMWLESVPE